MKFLYRLLFSFIRDSHGKWVPMGESGYFVKENENLVGATNLMILRENISEIV